MSHSPQKKAASKKVAAKKAATKKHATKRPKRKGGTKKAPKKSSAKKTNTSGSQKTREDENRQHDGEDLNGNQDLSDDSACYLIEVEGGAFVSNEPFPSFNLDSDLTETSPPLQELSVKKLRSNLATQTWAESWLNDRTPLETKPWEEFDFMELNEFRECAELALSFYGARLLDALCAEITENNPPENELEDSCCRIIEGLGYIAAEKTNKVALIKLLKIARVSAEILERVTEAAPELVQSVSKSEKTWPLNLGGREHQIKNAKARLRNQIKLGSEIIAHNKKSADLNKPITKTALLLIKYIEKFRSSQLVEPGPMDWLYGIPKASYKTFEECYSFTPEFAAKMRSLEEFSINSHEEWAEVCWELLMLSTDDHPEDTPSLKDERKGASNYYKKEVETPEDTPASKNRHHSSLKTGLESSIRSIATSYKEINEIRFIT